MAFPFLLMLGCVVQYGDPVATVITEEIAAPVSFSEVEARIDKMLVGLEDIDRVDRLLAARNLASHMKSQSPASQRLVLDYLVVLVEVEERSNPMDVWARSESEMSSFIAMPVIEEEVLIIEDPIAEDPIAEDPIAEDSTAEDSTAEDPIAEDPIAEDPIAEDPIAEAPVAEPDPEGDAGEPDLTARIVPREAPDTAAMIESARVLLESGDPYLGMKALEACLGERCWPEVAGLWAHARDLYVYQRREEAAELFLRTRAEPNRGLRISQLREVEETLYKLLAQYPNTRYAPAIQRNVALVQGELNSLLEP